MSERTPTPSVSEGSGFTPGPWFVTLSKRRGTLCVISEDTWICGELKSDNATAIESEEAEANAKLIAAAPALFAAHEANDGDLQLLRMAVVAGDPTRELLLRIDDMRHRTAAALKAVSP